MNRIILIGNGFDLAHGLKTSYKNFIDDLWETKKKLFTKSYQEKKITLYEDDDIVINDVIRWGTVCYNNNENILTGYKGFLYFIKNGYLRGNLTFKNSFLKIISEKSYLQNWVDIEDEYYQQLKHIIQNKSRYYTGNTAVSKLNEDFEEVKKELEKYLINELNNRKLNNFNLENIGQGFNIVDFSSEGIVELRNGYFSKTEEEQKKFEHLLEEMKRGLSGYAFCKTQIYPERTLLLNFNYTDLPKKLKKNIQDSAWQLDNWAKKTIEVIQIHGELNNPNYPIIFGYGDEQDETHKEIEKRGGDYLENVKTINYLKTPNYKNLLTFVENDKYQVLIMGHSCGLSDKTLLNTLFEHENCVSVKPFYYIDEKGHNNYNDIVENIYRCFTNKSMMREKVVNLKYCKPFSE
ncbi:MAG: bacteriophage abortive infection AbiH family protein [Paludibacter sp.]|jgi:hypothetical protein|nr:bacteriophage abortive infection AbiH family protein [Paludibacter sp.]